MDIKKVKDKPKTTPFICIQDKNVGVDKNGKYRFVYKKGVEINVPNELIEDYKRLNIIR